MFTLKLLIVFLFVRALCEGASVPTFAETHQRSARWDAYLQSLKDAHEERRIRRQTGASEWESNRANCNPADYLTQDTIGRRASGLLAQPQDQGSCGSCWAFATVNTLTDQLSIAQRSSHPLLSADFLTKCNRDKTNVGNGTGNGCCGAALDAGPKFIRETGAVIATCSPYSLSTWKTKNDLPTCPRTCSDGSSLSQSSFMTMGYQHLNTDQEIENALETGSVVLAGMIVTEEFFTYACGVYHDSGTTNIVGAHAVEIVDYGTTSSGTAFWVVKNSWGVVKVGNIIQENGFFRINRGELLIGVPDDIDGPTALRIEIDSNTQETLDFTTCVPAKKSNPTSDEMVMSAVDFAIEQLVNMNSVSCTDGMTATGLTADSVMSAEAQVIAGARVDISITASVTGCTKSTKADITASVIISTDGSFTLNTHTVSTRSSTKCLGGFWWPLLFLYAAMTAILLLN